MAMQSSYYWAAAASNASGKRSKRQRRVGQTIGAAKVPIEQSGDNMALTRDFKETILARARRDARFSEALFTEAINAYLAGDTAEGKAILRDLVNATVGFEGLASAIKKPSKSLHRMLAPRGNPSTENFFGIVNALQKKTHLKLRVTAKAV
ncbi:MAG: transcriptional regulator [Burkholderiales bacterium]